MNEFLILLLPWPARAFNPITDIFVYGILLSFLICLGIFLWKTILRSRLISNLVNEVSKHVKPAKPDILPQLKEEFDRNSNELAEVWQEFQNSLITREPKENQQKIVYKTDEASIFFSEERLLGQYMNLRFWNSVPALLVGLGILGTFVGLVWGLLPFSNIDFQQTENIRSAIQSLLSGVSTAFVTSVWGMLLSLLFNWIEKSCIGWVSSKIAVLQRTMDQLFTLTTQEEIAFRQEDELAQQTQALKAFSTDLANEIKSAMAQGRQEIIAEFRNAPETFSNAIGEQLTPSLNHLNNAVTDSTNTLKSTMVDGNQQIFQQLSNIHQFLGTTIEKQLAPNLDNLNNVVSEIKQTIVEGNQEVLQELRNAPDAFGNALEEKFAPSFNNLNSAVEALQRHKAESSADAIQQLVEEFQQSLSGSATTQMEALAETVNKASQSLITLPEQLASMMLGVQEQVNQTRQLLSETSQNQTEQVKIMMESVSNAFENAIDTHEAGLTATTDSMSQEMKQIANDIRNLLESTANRTDAQLAQRIADIETTSAQSIQTLQKAIADLQQALTQTAAQTTEESSVMITRMRELLESSANRTNERLAQRIADMAETSNQSIETLQTAIDEMQQGLTRTAAQTVEGSGEMIARMQTLLESSANRTDKQLAKRIVDIEKTSTESIQTLQTTIAQLQESITSTASHVTEKSEAMINKMYQLVDQSGDRLNTIFQAGESSISGLLKQQETQIKEINTQILNSREVLEKSTEMLEQMEASVTSAHELVATTRTLSDQLVTAANILEDGGERLMEASDAFSEETTEYLKTNRETIEQIQSMQLQSRQLLNDFSTRFETIDAGLKSIFEEIEGGLTNYSTTARDSINTYLSDFSNQLTKASAALAGGVEALKESVDELTDMAEDLTNQGGYK